MEMKIRMVNLYDQKETHVYSDDKNMLVRNLLEVFCIEEDDAEERPPKNIAFITTPYKVEITPIIHQELLKAISDIKYRTIDKIVISSIFEGCEVQNTIIERK